MKLIDNPSVAASRNGLRGYKMDIFEDLLPGAFGSHTHTSTIVELTGRVGGVLGRARIGFEGRDDDQRAIDLIGLSLRIPTSWVILDYGGWMLGLDYDRFTRTGSYTIHRTSTLLTRGF